MPMRIDLEGKTAIVTGAARGVGQACAMQLARAGARVIAVDVDARGAQETVDAIGHGMAIGCDLIDPEQIDALREQVIANDAAPDILVNCAGLIFYRQGITAVSVAEWDTVMNINLRGTFLVCRAFMDTLKSRGDGRILTFSSMAARVGGIDVGMHYTASKAGIIGLTRSLAKEGGPYGVTANAIAPGIILTGPVKEQVNGRQEEYISQVLLARLGEANDVANVVTFLSSPFASYITGVVLDVNGGMYMG